MPNPDELIVTIERVGEEYAQFIEAQSEEAFHRRPAPDEWTAAELTGHVAEFPVTFSAQALRLSKNPNAQLGRSLDDPGRLAAVEKLAGAGPAEAAAQVRGGIKEAVAALRAISPDGWRVKGDHPRLGEIMVAEVVEHFIVDHIQDHLDQARQTVGA